IPNGAPLRSLPGFSRSTWRVSFRWVERFQTARCLQEETKWQPIALMARRPSREPLDRPFAPTGVESARASGRTDTEAQSCAGSNRHASRGLPEVELAPVVCPEP